MTLRAPTLTGGAAVTVHGLFVGVKPLRASLPTLDALPVMGHGPKVAEHDHPVHQGQQVDECEADVKEGREAEAVHLRGYCTSRLA